MTEARSWPRRRVRRTCVEPRGSRDRQLDRDHELVPGEGRHARPDPQRVHRDAPRACHAGDHEDRAVDEQGGRGVGGGRGVAQVPRQRRAVPDLGRADDQGRLRERREMAADPRVGGDIGHHGPCPDDEAPRRPRRSPRRAPGSPLTSTTTSGRIEPSRSRMTRSVPPASGRAAGPCRSSRAIASATLAGRTYSNARIRTSRGPGRLRRAAPAGWRPGRRSTAGPRSARRTPPGRAQWLRVDDRHRDPRGEQLVEQEVVLQRVERLELLLERDHVLGRRVEVAVDGGHDHDVDRRRRPRTDPRPACRRRTSRPPAPERPCRRVPCPRCAA